MTSGETRAKTAARVVDSCGMFSCGMLSCGMLKESLMTRLIILGLMRPVGWIVVGLIAVGVGVWLFSTAHVVHPVEVNGTFDSITDYSHYGYDHSEIKLTGNPTVYIFDKNAMMPQWPDTFVQGGNVQLWVDQGTTHVVAITDYDASNENATHYVTDAYLHPENGLAGRTSGLITGAAGVVVTLAAIIWAFVAGSRKRAAKEHALAAVGAGQNAALQQRYGGAVPPMPPTQRQEPSGGQ